MVYKNCGLSSFFSLYNAPLKSRLSDHSLLSRRLHHSNTGMATPLPVSYTLRHQVRTLFTLSLCCCPSQNRLVSPAHHTTHHNHSCITTNRVALSSCQIPLAPCVCLSRPLHNRNNATLLVVVFCLRLISCSLIVPPRRRRAGPRAVADRARPAGAAGPTASRASSGGRGWARPLQ